MHLGCICEPHTEQIANLQPQGKQFYFISTFVVVTSLLALTKNQPILSVFEKAAFSNQSHGQKRYCWLL
jgi:hypothetical protein